MANANYNLSSTLTINATSALAAIKSVDTGLTSLSTKIKSTQAAFSSFGAGSAGGFNTVTANVTKTGAAVDQLNLKSKAMGTGFVQSAGQISTAVTSINTPLNTTTQSALKLDTSFKQMPISMRQIDSAAATNTASLGRVNQSALGNIQSQTNFRAKLADTSQGLNQTTSAQDNLEKSGTRLQDRIGGIVSRVGGMVFSITGMIQSYSEAIAMQGLLETSQQRVQEATVALSQAIIENGASSTEAVRAQQELTDAQRALSFQNRVTMLSWQDMIPFAVLLGITSSKLASQHLPALIKGKQAAAKAATDMGNTIKSTVNPSLNIFGTSANSANTAVKPLAPTMVATSGALRTYTGAANTATVATNGLKFSIRALLVATGIGAGLVAASIAFDAWQRSSDAASTSTANFSTVTKEATNQINPLIEKVDATTEAFKNQVNQIDVLIGKYKEIPGAEKAVITPGLGKNSAAIAFTPDQFLKQRAVANSNDFETQKRMYDIVNKAGGNQLNTLSNDQIRQRLEGLRGQFQGSEIDYLKSQVLQFTRAQDTTGTLENTPFGLQKGYERMTLDQLMSGATSGGKAFDKFGARTDLAKNEGDAQKQLTDILKQKEAALKTLNDTQGQTNKGVNQAIQETLGLSKANVPLAAAHQRAIEQSKVQNAALADTKMSLTEQNKSLVATAESMGLNSYEIGKLSQAQEGFGGSTQQTIAKLNDVNGQLTMNILNQGKYKNAVYDSNIAQQTLQNGIVGAVSSFNDLLTSSIQNEQQTRTYNALLNEHAQNLGVQLPAGIEKTTKNMELLVTAAKGSSASFEELQNVMINQLSAFEQFGAKMDESIIKGLKENGKKFEKETRKHLEDVFGKATMKEFELDAKAKFKEKELLTMIEQDLYRIVSLTKLQESIIDPNITFDKNKFEDLMGMLKTEIETRMKDNTISELTGKNLTEQIDRALQLVASGKPPEDVLKSIMAMFTAPGGLGTLDVEQMKNMTSGQLKEYLSGVKPEVQKVGKELGTALYDSMIIEPDKSKGDTHAIEMFTPKKKGAMVFPAPDMTSFQSAVTTGMTTAKTTIVQNATLAMTEFGTEMTTGFTNTQAATDTFVTDFGTRINQMSEMMMLETGKINEEFALSSQGWALNVDTFITLFGERINQMSEMMLLETGLINEEFATSLATWITQFDVFITGYGERINQMSDMMLLETGVIGEELAVSLAGYITQFDEFIVQYGERINQMSDIMLLEAGAIGDELQTGIDTWQNQITSFIENYTNAIDGMSDVMADESSQVEDELQGGIDQWQRQIKSFMSNFEDSIDEMSDIVADEVAEVNKELAKIERDIKVNVSVNVNKSGGNAYGGEYQTEAFQPQLLMVGEGARREKVKITPAGRSEFQDERQKEIDKGVIMVAEGQRGGGGSQPIVLNETIIINNTDGSQRVEKRRKVFGGLGSH